MPADEQQTTGGSSAAVLSIEDLTVAYTSGGYQKTVVAGVDLTLRRGIITGLAGESGSGKSTAALAAIGFPIRGSTCLRGNAVLDAMDLLRLPPRELESLWGARVALLGQNNGSLLNPLRTIGFQATEPLRLHLGLSKPRARERVVDLLGAVGLPKPEQALRRYPHQFSGGQQQRIALAIAVACQPDVLVLDEPTTGLDVRTQLDINELIVRLARESKAGTLYISHDLAMLATVCDEIAIMYGGEIVELASARDVFRAPRHPYTAALIDAVPRANDERLVAGIGGRPPLEHQPSQCGFADRCKYVRQACQANHPNLRQIGRGHYARCFRVEEIGALGSNRTLLEQRATTPQEIPLLAAVRLECSHRLGGRRISAVREVTFAVAPAETLAIVGESGSGKSTLLRALAGLHQPSGGWTEYRGVRLAPRVTDRPREVRRSIQLIFQNPDTSLNPRQTIDQILQRPIALLRPEANRHERREIAEAALHDVLLDSSFLSRRPHELSGGQRQRVAIARAFAMQPAVLLCDEVVSALDVSVAAAILELLAKLAAERETGLVFVTHNLAVVRAFADRIAVMKDGRFVEEKVSAELFLRPEHEHTRELISAVPEPEL